MSDLYLFRGKCCDDGKWVEMVIDLGQYDLEMLFATFNPLWFERLNTGKRLERSNPKLTGDGACHA